VTNTASRETSDSLASVAGNFADDRASILLVDDRPDKLMALETILASLGQNLILAHSGTEALRLLLQQDVALIVLDVSMPGMDGFETASLIRQRKNSELTPIIFISAVNYSDIHLSRGYSLGAVDYIPAPIIPEILRAKVSFFIELYKKTEQLKRQAEMQAQLTREQAARAEAEAANRAKDRFLAMLSHELRTPLTPVLLASSIFSRDQTVPDNVREAFNVIARNVQLEARLIDDLLDITRISQGKFNLAFEIADAHELLRCAYEMCQDEIPAKNLQVQFELEALEYAVRADPARLQQVFWNLIKNAIKFSLPAGQIRLRSSNPEEGRFRIEVIDSGVGIASDSLPKIFDPFEQAGSARSGGLGLGLAISKAIVELHGGQVSAFSAGMDHGATFVIELPNVVRSSAALCQSQILRDVSEDYEMAKVATHYRILLVEDHLDTVRGMQLFLEAVGYLVTTTESVSDALRIADQQEFDLLITDIALPDGNGEDLLRQLREKGYRFPSIALSGYGMAEDRARSGAAGFHLHLVKPVLAPDLHNCISRLLSRS
jgi:signal transduction histidine kinase